MINYFYMVKGPGQDDYTFCSEKVFNEVKELVGEDRPEPFVFIGDDAEGQEWRGKKHFNGYRKEVR